MTKIIALNKTKPDQLNLSKPVQDVFDCVKASTENLQEVLHLIEKSLENNTINETEDTHS